VTHVLSTQPKHLNPKAKEFVFPESLETKETYNEVFEDDVFEDVFEDDVFEDVFEDDVDDALLEAQTLSDPSLHLDRIEKNKMRYQEIVCVNGVLQEHLHQQDEEWYYGPASLPKTSSSNASAHKAPNASAPNAPKASDASAPNAPKASAGKSCRNGKDCRSLNGGKPCPFIHECKDGATCRFLKSNSCKYVH
jgi:hypothetical protein